MKISNFSLSYSAMFRAGRMDVFGFLSHCRELGVEGASLHVQDLTESGKEYLGRVRRVFLNHGLSFTLLAVSTDFGRAETEEAELEKAQRAVETAAFLGAPVLRIFAGSPPSEAERDAAFARAAAAVRRLCAEATAFGIPIGLQNHNHDALCRTGEDVVRFFKAVDHPNLTFVLDTGQFAGSQGASGRPPPELEKADYLESIRWTASLARHVRTKFYRPAADGSEPWIDYDKVFDILRGVHYQGFVDVLYEPQSAGEGGEEATAAVPRIVRFLREKIGVPAAPRLTAASRLGTRYAGVPSGRHFTDNEAREEVEVAFLEGPAVDRSGSVYFSDIPAERILKWDPARRKLSVFRESSHQANGLRFDRDGRLLACEGGGRVTRTEFASGEVTVLAESFAGKPLGSPNDLEVDAASRVYFTSRLGNRDPEKGNVNAVYRIDAPGSLVRLLAWPQIDMPNGIATSPDDRTLYLVDADGREGGARRIRAYDLSPTGDVSQERLVYDFSPGRSGDGMAVDAEGNLYVAAGLHRRRGTSETLDTRPGIHVVAPDGRLLDFLETPEDTLTNCSFGGEDLRTLYITCGKRLLSVRCRIPGKASYRPEK
jgi:gluconolactonase